MSIVKFFLLFWPDEIGATSTTASAAFEDAEAWEDITAWEV